MAIKFMYELLAIFYCIATESLVLVKITIRLQDN